MLKPNARNQRNTETENRKHQPKGDTRKEHGKTGKRAQESRARDANTENAQTPRRKESQSSCTLCEIKESKKRDKYKAQAQTYFVYRNTAPACWLKSEITRPKGRAERNRPTPNGNAANAEENTAQGLSLLGESKVVKIKAKARAEVAPTEHQKKSAPFVRASFLRCVFCLGCVFDSHHAHNVLQRAHKKQIYIFFPPDRESILSKIK